MHLHYRNVNDAFRSVVDMLHRNELTHGSPGQLHGFPAGVVASPSRNGSVLMIDEPVTITYTHPTERVLFNTARDANPLFMLYESLWMLSGRNDVASVSYYAKQMREYSDDGVTLNGAYGYRWRHAIHHKPHREVYDDSERIDQLDIIVNHLKADPNSRRAVLQMWNVEDDLLKISGTPRVKCERCERFAGLPQYDEGRCECYLSGKAASKDVCCNLSVMFAVRTTYGQSSSIDPLTGKPHNVLCDVNKYLDMTVTNRSNDLIWGLLGANYVHFTFLQEYMASRLGVGVGRYHHFTNNLHVYDEPDKAGIPKWQPDKWLDADNDPQQWVGVVSGKCRPSAWYQQRETLVSPPAVYVPLVKDPTAFDRELRQVVGTCWGYPDRTYATLHMLNEPFLQDVAVPAFGAFANHKVGDHKNAVYVAQSIKADDWRIACTSWLQRRKK